MRKKLSIVILDSDNDHYLGLCAMLEEKRYRAIQMPSLESMQKYLQKNTCLAVILDIEHESVDNRIIRNLTMNYPAVYFFGMSKRHYNPELREAICYHIFVCLNKPVNPDELYYWLRSIDEDESDPNNHCKV